MLSKASLNKATKPMLKIYLKSSDDVSIPCKFEAIKCSLFLRRILLDSQQQHKAVVIKISRADAASLVKIIEWGEYHHNEDFAEGSAVSSYVNGPLCEWDANYLMDMDLKSLLKLVRCVHSLEINGLFEIICKHVAGNVMGKTPAELRQMFDVPEEMGDEEFNWEEPEKYLLALLLKIDRF